MASWSRADALDRIKLTIDDAGQNRDFGNVFRGCELWLKATGNLVNQHEVKQDQTVELSWSVTAGPEAEPDEG